MLRPRPTVGWLMVLVALVGTLLGLMARRARLHGVAAAHEQAVARVRGQVPFSLAGGPMTKVLDELGPGRPEEEYPPVPESPDPFDLFQGAKWDARLAARSHREADRWDGLIVAIGAATVALAWAGVRARPRPEFG